MRENDYFKTLHDRRTFRMENNMLIGQELTENRKKVNIGEEILDKLTSNPDFVSQIDTVTNVQSTNREMRERSIKCALWLKKQGVKKSDIVTICTHNHINTYVPCFGSLYIGAVMNPLDNKIGVGMAQYFIQLIEPKVIFSSAACVDTMKEALIRESKYDSIPLVVFENVPGYVTLKDIFDSQTDAEVEAFRCTELTDPLHPAMILHSSGTTGMPKAAILCHSRISWPDVLLDVGLNPNTIALWYSPLFWIMSGILMINCILFDVKRIICAQFDERNTCDLIEKHEINWMLCASTMLSRLAKSRLLLKHKLLSLRWIMTGGAMVSKNTLTECQNMLPHTVVQQCYGMTEAGAIAIQDRRSKAGSVGTVSRGVTFKVINAETGEALGPNKEGEICAKTPSCMLGYWKNPEATRQTIDEEGFVHTGDLGYYNEEGDIFVIDRLKELIKFRGYHIAPMEIEQLLMSHPSVVEAAVVSVRHPTDEEHPVAFVVKKPGQKVAEQELIDLVAKNLEDYKKLRAGVVWIDELPLTASGKISKKDLRTQARTAEISEESRRLRQTLARQKEEDLRRKAQLIEDITAIQAFRSTWVKEFDPTETSGSGLLCEMSLTELIKRLYWLKLKSAENAENRKAQIRQKREKQKNFIVSTQNALEEYKACRSEQRRAAKAVDPANRRRDENTSGLEVLQAKLKERRALTRRLQK